MISAHSIRLAALEFVVASGLAGPHAPSGLAPAIAFSHFSTLQGLSQSTVNAILQDRLGFMWFGTQDGLNKFDGYTYTVYRRGAGDSRSISDNYIWCLLQDRRGNIWVGTLNDGLNCYRTDEDLFVRFRHDPADPASLSANDVTALCEDTGGNLWVGTWGGGLDVLDRATGKFRHYRSDPGNPDSLRNNFIRSICEDSSGVLWIGTWGGLHAFDRKRGSFTRFLHDPRDARSIGGNQIVLVATDSRNNLWVGTLHEGLQRLDRATGAFLHYRTDPGNPHSPGSDALHSMAEDQRGMLWFGSPDDGVTLFDPATETFARLRREAFNPRSLSSDRIYALCCDRGGAVWVGTADAGLSRYDPSLPEFVNYAGSPDSPTGLSNSVVRAVREDREGNLWVGTAGGGVNWFDSSRRRVAHYRHVPGKPASLGSNSVMAIFEDRGDSLWIGTDGGGLDRFERSTSSFIHYRQGAGPRTISGNSIMAITEDHERVLWVGTTGSGLDRYDRQNDTFVQVRGGEGDPIAAGSSIWAIHEDRRGILWLGTWGAGLARFDPVSGTVRRFLHDPGLSSSLSNNTVWSIYEDSTGILWLGTWGGGLERFDPEAGVFTHITRADGLPDEVVYGVVPDGKGNLWVSTNDGLARFTPSLMSFRTYDETDGLQGSEFDQGAFCSGRDGRLYFGGVNGLSSFWPDSLKSDPRPPAVVLTSFKIFDKPAAMPRAIATIPEIDISYRDSFIAFEFAALDYAAPERNQYAYRLEGFDNDWVLCGGRRYAAYTGLSGGTYVFHVKAANKDGVWNEKGASVRIVIDPPFWRTWWFSLLAAAALASGLYALYLYRMRRLLEMERLRTRIASDLHDELASNLSSIALFSTIVHTTPAATTALPADHARLLDRITALSLESVASIRDIIWAIDPKPETIFDLLLRLKDYVLPLAHARNIAAEFEEPVRESLPSHNLSPEQRKNLWLLLKEVLMNAIRHAACTELAVKHTYAAGILRIVITDDGKGFDPQAEHAGKGMRTIRSRAKILGAALVVESTPGCGTTVRLTLRA